jgi:hypothetical protein
VNKLGTSDSSCPSHAITTPALASSSTVLPGCCVAGECGLDFSVIAFDNGDSLGCQSRSDAGLDPIDCGVVGNSCDPTDFEACPYPSYCTPVHDPVYDFSYACAVPGTLYEGDDCTEADWNEITNGFSVSPCAEGLLCLPSVPGNTTSFQCRRYCDSNSWCTDYQVCQLLPSSIGAQMPGCYDSGCNLQDPFYCGGSQACYVREDWAEWEHHSLCMEQAFFSLSVGDYCNDDPECPTGTTCWGPVYQDPTSWGAGSRRCTQLCLDSTDCIMGTGECLPPVLTSSSAAYLYDYDMCEI